MQEKWMPSPHYSTSRGPYNKIVLHTTEGAMTIEALGNWFANPSAGCSSHHGADQYTRTLGAYVYENHKAWTQGNANPYCLSLEMCAYASWSRDTWLSKPVLLDNAAEWIRYCVDKYQVPWTLLNNTQAQNPDVRGICQHVNFGSWGSGHHDCGSGFPMDVVVDKAKKWGGSSGGTGESSVATSAICYDKDGNTHMACVWEDGKVNYRMFNRNGTPANSWSAVDPASNAKGGVSIAMHDDYSVIITYINQGNKVCVYMSPPNTPGTARTWSWADRGGPARA